MSSARLLGSRDTVIVLQPDEDLLIGRGSNNIPATDKRCSRQSIKVRFDAAAATVIVTQIGVNPGIVHHGTPQESYMVQNQTYSLTDGQKFTVLMHDYEFTVSVPTLAPASKSVEEPAPTAKANKSFDWMDDEETEKTEMPGKAAKTSSAASAVPSASTDSRPICKYGATCYRNNPTHFKQFSHPHREQQTKPPSVPVAAPSVAPKEESIPTHLEKAVSAIPTKPEAVTTKEIVPEKIASPAITSSTLSPTLPNPNTTSNTGKRPAPALDLMDDEENYLPKSKKPKSAAATVGKGNAMDWMNDENDEKPPQDAPTKAPERMDVDPVVAPSAPAQEPESKKTSTPSPVSSQSTAATSSAMSVAEKEAAQNSKRPVQASVRPSSDSDSTTKSDALASVKLSGWQALEDAIKSRSKTFASSVAVVVPSLGRGFNVQESVDLLLETFEKYISLSKSGDHVRLWFWPESPAWAAAFRRRLPSTNSNATFTNSNGANGVSLASLVTMMPPNSSLAEQLPLIKADQIIIVNESNWRFKGIGAVNSFNVQLNKLYSAASSSNPKSSPPSLLNDTKANHSVGAEGCAYPVEVAAHSELKQSTNPNISHVVQLVPPTAPESSASAPAPQSDANLLKDAIISAFGCLVQISK